MKSLAKLYAKKGIWSNDIAHPKCGHNDVVIKIHKTAICGTDMHIFHWDQWAQETIKPPLTTGHEFVGTVYQTGSHVVGLTVGDRVSGEGHITCSQCRNCRTGKRHLCSKTIGVGVHRTGAFAEYLAIPADNVYPIPSDINDNIAAILDPFGNATHAALSFDVTGEDVLITGAGPIGAMAAAITKHIGARNIVVTDVNDFRLGLAKEMGATCTINVAHKSIKETMEELGMQEGFAVGLEMSGHSTALHDMLEHINHGGKIAMLGIPEQGTSINWQHVIFKGLTIKGIYGREMYETWYKMVSMLQSGLDISPIITHQFDAEEFQKAFDTMASGQSGKVILNWN